MLDPMALTVAGGEPSDRADLSTSLYTVQRAGYLELLDRKVPI